MSNAIQKFQQAKAELGYIKAWANLIGSEYHGGGGGIGEIVKAHAEFTIYHQACNGSTNYHECREASPFVNEAVRLMGGAIIRKAIALAEANMQELAKAALAEAEEVTAAAKATP